MKINFKANTAPQAAASATPPAPAPSAAQASAPGDGPAASAPVIDVQSTVVHDVPTPVPGVSVTCETTTGGVTTAVATVPKNQLPEKYFDDGSDGIKGSDLLVPRLNIVARVGDLSTKFPPGGIVLDGKLAIFAPGGAPVEFVSLAFAPRRYVEKIEGGEQGETVDSVEEVVARGGTIDYKDAKANKKTKWDELDTLYLIVKGSKDANQLKFPLEFQGDRWALVKWSMKGSAFTRGAQVIRTARAAGHLKAGHTQATWLLTTDTAKFRTGNVAVVPVLEVGTATTPEFRAWAGNVLPT